MAIGIGDVRRAEFEGYGEDGSQARVDDVDDFGAAMMYQPAYS